MGTTSSNGTKVTRMVSVISAVNTKYSTKLSAKNESFDTWQKLRGYLKLGYPIVLRVKSWLTSGEHYVMMFGFHIYKI